MENTALEPKRTDSLPGNFEEVTGLAKAFITSGYFADTRQLAQAIVKIQAGRELGIPPVYAMQNINLIRNRLCSSANTLALLVKRSGKYNYQVKEHTDTVCSITFFEANDGKWVEIGESTFTIEDAKRAELVKPDSGWVKYPRAMLFSRAISQGARIYCPDAIGGMYTDEEIRSIPAKSGSIEDLGTEKLEPDLESSNESPKGASLGSIRTVLTKKGYQSEADQLKALGINEFSEIKDFEKYLALAQCLENKPKAKPKEEQPKEENGQPAETTGTQVLITRSPDSVKTLEQMRQACFKDFTLQPGQVLKELNANSWSEITQTPWECYLQIAMVYQDMAKAEGM